MNNYEKYFGSHEKLYNAIKRGLTCSNCPLGIGACDILPLREGGYCKLVFLKWLECDANIGWEDFTKECFKEFSVPKKDRIKFFELGNIVEEDG